jgi:alginate O-acetyltransferase complex protein AlgI
MLFFQLEFIIFLAILIVLRGIIKGNAQRKAVLLAASYYFYAFIDYRWLSLVLISTFTDYIVGLALSSCENKLKRKLLLIISLSTNLCILCLFKYYDFFVSSFAALFYMSTWNQYLLHIALPLGISYYTFQTMNYTIDVYRRKSEACRSILDYSLFVCFFPSILSGPIVRASSFLPQLKVDSHSNLGNLTRGLRLFIMGLFLKIFMADRLGMFVDVVFESPGVFDSLTVWLAVLSYTLQIYFDFAGYSDMAIGVAKMLGYDIGINFNYPYLAGSISEFWKRWHISLSTWIRDYLYFPLGGSRKGGLRTIFNLVFVMLLCGLWHGASWTFVLWGGYHGVALAVNRFWSKSGMKLPRLAGWVLTMLVVMVGWVFFRSPDMTHASLILRQMFLPHPGTGWIFPFAIFAVLATALVHVVEYTDLLDVHRLPLRAWYTPAILFSMLWMVVIFHPEGFRPFVYLNF